MITTTATLKTTWPDARILIVDDHKVNTILLENILSRSGFTDMMSITDAREVLAVVNDFKPDIILLDLWMPYFDGFELLSKLTTVIEASGFLPVLVLTGDVNPESKKRALAGGAKDFLTKPFDGQEVVLRVTNLLETRSLYLQLHDRNMSLDEQVRARTVELEAAQVEMLERLAWAAEYRDDETGRHIQRVGNNAAVLAQALGLESEQVTLIQRAATMHDVGKIGVPDSILLKPGRLTPQEFEVIKQHTNIGARILADGHSSLVRMAATIAFGHHEKWDGTGYPQCIMREAIPIEGRIVSVVDTFDALTHKRPYKEAWPVEEALAEIKKQTGSQFDPLIAEAFMDSISGLEL
ncbi:MAG: HD domain-containing phosphohydrolase [Chloroflexia bacterium]